jgi:hypothetical protein
LIFWAAVEGFKDAYPALDRARRCVEPFLNSAFAQSALSTLACKLRYVPIVMPVGMRERYPARSKLRKKEQLYDCSPQLDYDVFVTGTFEAQLDEYLRGIALSAPHLSKLGASKEQVSDFERILATARDRILAERPDQTRH